MRTTKHSFFHRFFCAYNKNILASFSLKFLILLVLIGIYAPLFASSKPLVVSWRGEFFFPLFRYLFFPGFYTKPIDLFFNILMFTLPFFLLSIWLLSGKYRTVCVCLLALFQVGLFAFVMQGGIQDPAVDARLRELRTETIVSACIDHPEAVCTLPQPIRSWESEKGFMNSYEQLNLLIKAKSRMKHHQQLQKFLFVYDEHTSVFPTLYSMEMKNEEICLQRLHDKIAALSKEYPLALENWKSAVSVYRPTLMHMLREKHNLQLAKFLGLPSSNGDLYAQLVEKSEPLHYYVLEARKPVVEYHKLLHFKKFIEDKRTWIRQESEQLKVYARPLFSQFHWEDDAGGSKKLNQYVHWWQLTRINRKDLLSSLIFGIRVAIVVGGLGASIALFLGIIFGSLSGYFGGKVDMILSRFMEIWETMPMLFILMLFVSISQKKSLLLDTVFLGCFGWTGFCRYIRMETLRQRGLPYVFAAKNLGYSNYQIMVHQILPNASISVVALFPFSMMAMISCEAGLTFLGLGEENSVSWGSLMREGVSAFPAESVLLWPPAIMLTLFLLAIALIGDGVRDALDPKLQK